jgi:Fur family transcriptional regulator, ferric uptake regulator
MRNRVPERSTRQKRAVREVFERSERPLATEEVLAEAKRLIGSIGIATVYRAIRSLVADGFVTPVELPGFAPLYERADKGHHHHFVCTVCQRAYELAGCESDIRAKVPRGFRITGHEVTLFGICASCRSPEAASGAKSVRAVGVKR